MSRSVLSVRYWPKAAIRDRKLGDYMKHTCNISLILVLAAYPNISASEKLDSGADTFPPDRQYLDSIFQDNVESFEELVQLMDRSGWVEACNGGPTADLRAAEFGQQPVKSTSEIAKNIRARLETVGMVCVWLLESGGYAFEPAYIKQRGNYIYEVRVTNRGGNVDVPTCEEVTRSDGPGYCLSRLAPDWRIEYSWDFSPEQNAAFD